MSGGNSPELPPRRRGKRWRFTRFTLLLLLFFGLGGAGFIAWKGPSSGLRWAVRMWDPALRLKSSPLLWRDGELVLGRVELHFRGRSEPIFRARELRAGFGPEWRQGRLGSLVLEEPALSLDKRVLDYFTADCGRSAGVPLPWEFDRVEIQRGHMWLDESGEPALDISVNIDGTLQRVGPDLTDNICPKSWPKRMPTPWFSCASWRPSGSCHSMMCRSSRANPGGTGRSAASGSRCRRTTIRGSGAEVVEPGRFRLVQAAVVAALAADFFGAFGLRSSNSKPTLPVFLSSTR